MCGIAGMVDMRGERIPDRGLLERMTDTLQHRGPDGSGLHIEAGVGLGHRRLAIIDLEGGRQPLPNEDGSVLVTFNGEIYNFQELARELTAAGHRFATHSDTEVIVHAWEEWGESCVQRFNGMFAFALWDRKRRQLFLVRDRFGVKPLFYAELRDGWLIFGSELKALLRHPGLDRSIEPTAVEDFFALGYVPETKSILARVAKLPPGNTLLLTQGQPVPAPRRYWDLAFRPLGARSTEDIGEELIARLRESVRLRMIADVPLGAFLSGGVDSSAVVAMMAELSNQPVQTCSIGFDDPAFDESRYGAEVAQQFHTDHSTATVRVDDFEIVDRLAGMFDEPFADSSAMPTFRVSELARRRVKVALSGDGGDETFAGYRRYKLHMGEERMRQMLPASVRRAVFGPLARLYPKLDWAPRVLRAKATLLGMARDSVEAYFNAVSITPVQMRVQLFAPAFKSRLAGYSALQQFRDVERRAPTDHPLSLVQYIDFHTYLPGDILTKVDRTSMANSLEVREPVIDYTLVDWASGIDPRMKLAGGEGKYIFKKALERRLPNDILYRRKMGFAVPIGAWFRGPLRARLEAALFRGKLNDSGFFDGAGLRKLFDMHVGGRRDFGHALWATLMFERFLERIAAPV
jgi:asparagine synthase (glutamine-hydrolysing)